MSPGMETYGDIDYTQEPPSDGRITADVRPSFSEAQKMVDRLILATPTGETRNALTEINIVLLGALHTERS